MRLNLLDVSPMLFKLAGSKNLSNFNRQGSSKSEMEIAESEIKLFIFAPRLLVRYKCPECLHLNGILVTYLRRLPETEYQGNIPNLPI